MHVPCSPEDDGGRAELAWVPFVAAPGVGANSPPAADISLGTPGAGSPAAPNTDCNLAICSWVKGVAMNAFPSR